jgi:hypothetical protein
MRSSKPRPRSKNNRHNNNNNRSVANVMNRVFDSSGPEGKVRGTPQQVIEKYQQLTRDSQLSGDRVAAENFQQHAEHYMRLQADAQREIDARREQQDLENREKQAQRDQERNERPERSVRHDRSEPQSEPVEHEKKSASSTLDVSDLAETPQPDLAPLVPAELVQTTEVAKADTGERPKQRVRRRPPKPVVSVEALPVQPEPASED